TSLTNTPSYTFFLPRTYRLSSLLNNIIQISRAKQPTSPRNNTKCTEIITTFLNFKGRPCSVSEIRNIHFFKYTILHNVLYTVNCYKRLYMFFNYRNLLLPILCTNNYINPCYSHTFSSTTLSITTSYTNNHFVAIS